LAQVAQLVGQLSPFQFNPIFIFVGHH